MEIILGFLPLFVSPSASWLAAEPSTTFKVDLKTGADSEAGQEAVPPWGSLRQEHHDDREAVKGSWGTSIS